MFVFSLCICFYSVVVSFKFFKDFDFECALDVLNQTIITKLIFNRGNNPIGAYLNSLIIVCRNTEWTFCISFAAYFSICVEKDDVFC